MLLVFYTKATTKVNTFLLVGFTHWLRYLHSIGLGRKSQSPGGMYLPHLIHESSRMKGSQWQKFMLYWCSHTNISERRPWGRRLPGAAPAGWHPFHHHLGCISLPSLHSGRLPAPNHPKPTWDCTAPPFSATTHKHHPTPPMFTGWGPVASPPKPNRKTPRLPAPLHCASWGWRNWAMVAGTSWCVWAMPRAAVLAVGAGGGRNSLNAGLANGLTVESDGLSQTLKIRAKNQKQHKGRNWGQQRRWEQGSMLLNDSVMF